MTIEFACPGCQKLLRVQDESAGKKAKCPQCSTIAVVPDRPAGSAPAPSANPFQSPQAVDTGMAAHPVAAGEILPTQLDIGDVFSTTWRVFKKHWGVVLGAVVILFVVQFFFNFVGGMIQGAMDNSQVVAVAVIIVSQLVSVFLSLGLIKICLAAARDQEVEIGQLFSGGPYLLPFILAYIVATVIVLLGFVALIIPGIILALMISQFSFLIVDRNVGAMESLSLSRQIMVGNKLTLFAIYVLFSLGALVFVLITCGLGAFAAYPYMFLMMAVMYLKMTGQPIAD